MHTRMPGLAEVEPRAPSREFTYLASAGRYPGLTEFPLQSRFPYAPCAQLHETASTHCHTRTQLDWPLLLWIWMHMCG